MLRRWVRVKITELSTGATTQKAIGTIHDDPVNDSISQDGENVKNKSPTRRGLHLVYHIFGRIQ